MKTGWRPVYDAEEELRVLMRSWHHLATPGTTQETP